MVTRCVPRMGPHRGGERHSPGVVFFFPAFPGHRPPATANAMLHRRDAMIRLGQLGAGSLLLPTLAGASQSAPA